MAANKGGVLGESTTAASGTVTLYTVPSNRAARVKLQFRFVKTGGDYVQFTIAINGVNVLVATADADTTSSYIATAAAIAALSTVTIVCGTTDIVGQTAAAPTHVLAPWPIEHHLSAGDTVTLNQTNQSGNATAVSIQVIGIEFDSA